MQLERVVKMDKERILENVIDIIADQLDCSSDEIAADAKLKEDLDLRKLDIIEIAFSVETEFDISLDDGCENEWQTVSDIVDYVYARV